MSEWTVGDLALTGIAGVLIVMVIAIFYRCAQALTDLIYRGKKE